MISETAASPFGTECNGTSLFHMFEGQVCNPSETEQRSNVTLPKALKKLIGGVCTYPLKYRLSHTNT